MAFSLKDFPSRENLEKYALEFPELDVESAMASLEFMKTSREFMAAMERQFAGYGISMGKFMILMLLFRYRDGRGLTPTELAGKSGVTKATITGLLDGLEGAGLVSRVEVGGDRRKLNVALTDAGIAFIRGILPHHFSTGAKIMGALSLDEKNSLISLMRKLSASLASVDK